MCCSSSSTSVFFCLGVAFLSSFIAQGTREPRSKSLQLPTLLSRSRGYSTTQTTTTTATATIPATYTTTTSTTTVEGPAFLLISSTTTGSIYSWSNGVQSVLVQNIGDPVGIALGPNGGHLYYADPKLHRIVRYELAIRDGQVQLYDDQPVYIALGVNAEWIAVDEESNVFYIDPVSNSINKIYKSTIDQIARGSIQPDELTVVSYLDIYKKVGPPSGCFQKHLNGSAWPAACTGNCMTCMELWSQPYIYQVYTDQGQPSGLQIMPGGHGTGGTLLWGNRVDGFKRGSVVKAMTEPEFIGSSNSFTITPLTKLWDSVIEFLQLADNSNGQGLLYITANGTVGEPPIKGDVHGAVIAVEPATSNGPNEFITLDWNLVKPRSMAWDGVNVLYIADDFGIRAINSQMTYQDAYEKRIAKIPGSSGLVRINNAMPCYQKMVDRGNSMSASLTF